MLYQKSKEENYFPIHSIGQLLVRYENQTNTLQEENYRHIFHKHSVKFLNKILVIKI